MRHRIVQGTGLGNPDPALLNNYGEINLEFGEAAIKEYFDDIGGIDYHVTEDFVNVGIEPAYQYQKLKIISISKNKDESYIQTGKAWGPYGSGIARNTKYYKEYKRNCKFTRFVDKWYPILFGGTNA